MQTTETLTETPMRGVGAEALVSSRQLHILRHTLGLEQHGREYRNRYCPGGDDAAECAALEEAGLMSSYELDWIPGRTYQATDAGRDLARAG